MEIPHWLWLLLGSIGALYLLSPLLFWFKFRISTRPTIELIDPAALPEMIRTYFDQTAVGLQACGFQIECYMRIPDQTPNVIGIVALWSRRLAAQYATVVAKYYKSTAGPKRINKYLQYSTVFADGFEVSTNNSSGLPWFKRMPKKDALWACGIENPVVLHRLHQSRENRLAPPGAIRYLPRKTEDLTTSFAEGMAFNLQWQARGGYLRETSRDGVLSCTLQGACLMTWFQLTPLRQIRSALLKYRAEVELRLAEIQPVAEVTDIRTTHVSPYRII